MKKFILLGVLALLVVLGATAYMMWNKPHTKVEDTKAISVSASDLAKAFTDNEKQANEKYLNKALLVTGVVSEVDKNQDGGTMVVLQTGDPARAVQCTMRDKGITAEKNKEVKIAGFCADNGLLGISITDCILK